MNKSDIIIVGNGRVTPIPEKPGTLMLVDGPTNRNSLSMEDIVGRLARMVPEDDTSLFINTLGDVRIKYIRKGYAGTPAVLTAEGGINYIPSVTNTYEWTINDVVHAETGPVLNYQYPLVIGGKDKISVRVTNSIGNKVHSLPVTIEAVSNNEVFMDNMVATLPDIIQEGASGKLFIKNITSLSGNISVIVIKNVSGITVDRYQVPSDAIPFIYHLNPDRTNGDKISFDVIAFANDGTISKSKHVEATVTNQDLTIDERFNITFPGFVTSGQTYDLQWSVQGAGPTDYELLIGSLTNSSVIDASNIPMDTIREVNIASGLSHGDDVLIPWFLLEGGIAVLSGVVSSNALLIPPDINSTDLLINGSPDSSTVNVNVPFQINIDNLPSGTTVRYISQELIVGPSFTEILNHDFADTFPLTVKVPSILSAIDNISLIVEVSNGSSSSYRTVIIPVEDLEGNETFITDGVFTKPLGVSVLRITGHGSAIADASVSGDVNVTFPQVVNAANGEVLAGSTTEVIVDPDMSSNYNVVVPDGARIVMRW